MLQIVGVGLLLLFSQSRGQDLIGCFIPGECLDSYHTDYTDTWSSQDCLAFCQGNAECHYFTHYYDTGLCLAFVNCIGLSDITCTNCTSGDASCPDLQCFDEGKCTGILSGFTEAIAVSDCIDACKEDQSCSWWTYDSSGICFLYETCQSLDPCSSCTSGQKLCDDTIGSTSSTPESTSPTTSTTTQKSTTTEGDLGTYECGQDIDLFPAALVQSPGYPLSYPLNINCTSKVSVKPGKRVELEFLFFDVERASGCTDDYVLLYDGDSVDAPPLSGRLCNYIPPIDAYVSSGESMTMYFKSNGIIPAGGFVAYFYEV